MPSLRQSLAFSFAAKYTGLTISTISVVIIARLLTPAEIGIWSVGMAVTTLVHVVRDFGVGNYLVQEKALTRDHIRTAFGISIIVAWTMALVLFGASGVIARFYSEPSLRHVLMILSATFVVIPFSAPVIALLRRDMAYGMLYVISTVNALIHAMTAITLAALGHGPLSLAWATLAASAATLLAVIVLQPKMVKTWPNLKEWRRVAYFGGAYSLTAVVTRVGISTVDLVLGRSLGFVAVGLYSRANGLVSIFHQDIMNAIRDVALPAFSRLLRDGEDIKAPYLKGVSFVTVLAWPFYGFLGLMAYPVVRILFGSQWDAAVPLVQILAVAVAIGATWNLISQVLIATGQVNRLLTSELIIQPSRILLILIAVPFGLHAVAASQVLVYVIGMFVYYRQLFPSAGISYRDVIEATLQSMIVTIFSLVAPILVLFFMDLRSNSIWLPFSLAAGGTILGWLIGVLISSHPAKNELKFLFDRSARLFR